MEIKINVYADCTSEQPTKTYVIRRILFKTAKELATIQDDAKQEGREVETTLKMLKIVIPDFQDEDLDGIDPTELGEFFRKVGKEIAGVVEKAQKN